MAIDRTNQRYGRLLVTDRAARDERGPLWRCICDCGTTVDIPSRQFSGARPVQSCGCLQRDKARETGLATFKDRTGEKTGRLLVLRQEGRSRGRPLWRCLCDCGTEIAVRGSDLYPGKTQSCGCLQSERTAEANAARAKHGHARKGDGNQRLTTPEYRSRKAMMERCRNANAPNFHLYGGRGISVCSRWSGQDGFTNFLADMGFRKKGETLDRIVDVNGNYDPENCRWADAAQQAGNRRVTPEYHAARLASLARGRETQRKRAKAKA